MFGLLRMVAWTMTAIAMLLLFTTRLTHAQATESDAIRDTDTDRVLAARYEKILCSRPQLGTAFDKLYEIHAKLGTLVDLCERLEQTAKRDASANLFQLHGLLQMRQGLVDSAVASLAEAERLSPTDPLASLYLSQALTVKRQYAPALEALKNAVARKPSQSFALEIVKELRLLKDRGMDVDVAAKLLADLEQQFKTSPQVNEVVAEGYIDLGLPQAALPLYENLVSLTREPQRRIEIRIQLARLKKRLGEPQQALKDLEQLLNQVKPQSWLHSSLLEQIEQLTDEVHGNEGVIAYYQRTLQDRPEDVHTLLRFAKILHAQSRTEDAQKYIAKAIEASPTQPEPRLAMVEILEETKQIKLASETMQQLVQLDPSNVDYIVRWGRLESQSASSTTDQLISHANAASIWKRILVGHENDPVRTIQVAELLRSISLSEEALKLYKQAVQLSGENVEFSEILAEYLVELQRRDEARNVLTSSVSAAANDRESLFQLSSVLSRLQFSIEAIQALEKACESRAECDDLLQLADMQGGAGRIDAAVETLERANTVAVTSADFARTWDAQTKAYKQLSNLTDRIAEIEKTLQSSNSTSLEALQLLAIMQAANNQPAEAAATALRATLIAPEAVRAWLLTARMQREAGMSIREIDSLSELYKFDAKHGADYLQRIATIQFQINQFEQALATMEKVFTLPTANLQHFQMAASFCLQAKKTDQAVDMLKRATQVFPRDRSAWLLAARQFSELKNKSATLDAAWHVLELSVDGAQQREAVSLLVTTYQPDNASLLRALKQFGIEHEKEIETDVWSAWALLESDGNQPASEVIENILKRVDANPESLRAAIELAVRESDFSKAANIQRRINLKQTSNPEQLQIDRLKLGQWLWLSGEKESATDEWKSVFRGGANEALATAFARDLVDKSNWSLAATWINLGVESGVKTWDYLAFGVFANIQDKNLSKAAELSEQLLTLNLPRDTMIKAATPETTSGDTDTRSVPLSSVDRLTWIEQAGAWQTALNETNATRAGYRTNQSNPRASQAAAVRYLALQRGASLRSSSLARFNVRCYAEARAMAVLTRFGKVNQQRMGAAADFSEYAASAIAKQHIEQLWDCVLILESTSGRNMPYTTSTDTDVRSGDHARLYVDVLDTLIALNEGAAVELAVNEIVSRRQLQQQLADRLSQNVPSMDSNALARLESLIQKVERSDTEKVFNAKITMAIEFIRAQRAADGRQLLHETLAQTKDIAKLATSARQFLTNDQTTQQVVSQLLQRAFQLELESSSESTDLPFAIASFRSTDRSAVLNSGLIFDMIRLQAKHIEGLAADLVFSDSRSNESRRAYRSFRDLGLVMPDRSSILSMSLRAALFDSQPDELTKFREAGRAEEPHSPAERAVGLFIASVAGAMLNDPDAALASLNHARAQGKAVDIITLYEVWLLVANQRLEDAKTALDTIKPSNESIQRECELWRMHLGLKLGNMAEAQRAARALSKLPLSVQENSDVAAVLTRQ